MSGSPSEEDEGPPPTQRSALDPRTSSDHRRPYSPVAETVGRAQRVGVFNFGMDRVRVLEKIFRDGSGMDWVRVFASYI